MIVQIEDQSLVRLTALWKVGARPLPLLDQSQPIHMPLTIDMVGVPQE